jgi:DNA ligase (NAD+)
MNKRFELEQTYFSAKESYYTGEPIMSDDEFDALEKELIGLGSTAPYIVGADDRKAKYSHPSPMLSLSKFQATLEGIAPTAQATSWMKSTGAKTFEVTPKYDGNAANVIYKDGKLHQVLSRGNGTKGRDITDKIKHCINSEIHVKGIVEVRGEIVININTFNEKYAKDFRNARNYVAGVLNRDENPTGVIDDLVFIPVEVRQDAALYLDLSNFLQNWNFHKVYKNEITTETFEFAFQKMTEYREVISEYQLDGFVIKTPVSDRERLGENDHHPEWAIAIKFPPKEAITKIVDIQWNWGKTGEATPIAIMEPVDLDGTTVKRATMFNIGYVIKNGVTPGAIVSIAKSGDIIPQIQKVITPSTDLTIPYPTHCTCGAPTHIVEEIHLMCSDKNCESMKFQYFHQGVNQLELDGVGGAMTKTLWDSGFRSAVEILNPTKFNKQVLLGLGIKDGKNLDNLFEEIKSITELKPAEVLLMLGIDGLGRTLSRQLGNYLNGAKYSFHGLTKSVISGFEVGGQKRALYESAISELSQFIEITMPEIISESSIGFEMTGSPKLFGFKAKDEFIAYAKTKGYHHCGLKDAKILIVDDLNTSSSKMKTAQSKGITIMLYSEI